MTAPRMKESDQTLLLSANAAIAFQAVWLAEAAGARMADRSAPSE